MSDDRRPAARRRILQLDSGPLDAAPALIHVGWRGQLALGAQENR